MSSVCAIVPTFNRSALLVECLDSLLGQSRAVDEIVVVDDGSTDDTRERLRAYDGRVRLITQPNSGKAVALNRALADCRADYVWICDDDDYAAPDACALMARALDEDPAAGFAYGPFERFADTDRGRDFLPMSFWPDEGQTDFFLAALERLFVFQFGMLVRKSVYDRVGPFRQDLLRSQDYEMILRIARTERPVFVPNVLFYQRQHGGTRGPEADRFTESSQALRWLKYDRIIFEDLRQSLTLDELVPPFARNGDPGAARRAALIKSACVYAKRSLLTYAVQDLLAAADQEPSRPLSAGEVGIAERALTEDLSCDALASSPPHIAKLRSVGSTPVGASLLVALTRPLVWKTRKAVQAGSMGVAMRRLRLMSDLLGPVGAGRRIAAAALGGRAAV